VTFLQAHLASAPQGSNLDPLDSDSNSVAEIQTSWWVTDRTGGDGSKREELVVVPDEERDELKRNGTLQRKAALVAGGVEREADGVEDFETGVEEEFEEEEEEQEQESLETDIDDARDMELGDDGMEEVETRDVADNGSALSTVLSGQHNGLQVQDTADNQQMEKLIETNGLVTDSNKEDKMNVDTAAWDREINAVVDKKQPQQQDHGFKMVGNQESGKGGGRKARQGGTLQLEMEEKKQGLFFWDHTLGVRKKSLKNVEHLGPVLRTPGGTMKLGTAATNEGLLNLEKHEAASVLNGAALAKVSSQQLRGFKEFVENWKEQYNSDDETLDEEVQRQLEDVVEIEDALLLNEDGPVYKPVPRLPDKIAGKYAQVGGSSYDPINPVNIPMLQDPDTGPDTWMTKSDKAMLKALRVDGYGQSVPLQPKYLRGMDVISALHAKKGQESKRKLDEGARTMEVVALVGVEAVGIKKDQAAEIPREGKHEMLETHYQENKPHDTTAMISSQGLQSRANTQGLTHWRHVAGTHPSLTFTAFMQQFLHQDTCSIRVFMAWTTPPWSLTVRHQRTLESLFHFHPNACVVVFSETLEKDFFKTFVQEGFKVAVVQPDLQELLANTPTDIFTTVWVRWRETPLYYIHYTDLLRLVALYKYGGVYMDMDVILLKPLDSLHNAIGSEILANGEVRLNGAVMVFNKSSPFLRECLEEFTATYDDTLLEWNGAELVTRVANFSIRKGGKKWSEDPEALQIQPPFAFFPLTSSSILRYFVAPTDKQQEEEEKQLLGKIFEEAFTTHYWNRLTAQLVPENGSLIETVLNQHCLTCTDIL